MLKSHFDAVEKVIIALSDVAANTGHSLHRGNPREYFIQEFLSCHLGNKISIGTGEIICSQSEPRQDRNQFDIVLYRSDFPRIDIGGGTSCFLAESVVATIEIKSYLDKAELEKSMISASKAKLQPRHILQSAYAGYIPPGILSYIVAYKSSAKLNTVMNWVEDIELERSFNSFPLPETHQERVEVLSDSLEGIFILGEGMAFFDNGPISIIEDKERREEDNSNWVSVKQEGGNLLWLFLILSSAIQGFNASWIDWEHYLSKYTPNYTLR